jgi:hypothetical protein
MTRLAASPDDTKLLRRILDVFQTLEPLRLDLDLWRSQNIFFSLGQTLCRGAREKSGRGDAAAKAWLEDFEALGGFLRVNTVVTQNK